MDDLVITTLARAALGLAHPLKGGNSLEGGLAVLEQAEQRCIGRDSVWALRIAGFRGVMLLWHGNLSEAVVTLRHAADEASTLKHYGLRKWLYWLHANALSCEERAQASAA